MMAKIMRQIPWGRAMIILLVLWLIFLLLALGFLRHEPDQQTNQRISQALRDLQSLHQQREEITKLLSEYSTGNFPTKQEEKYALLKSIQDKVMAENSHGLEINDFVRGGRTAEKQPSLPYEQLRRRLHMGIEEMWFFVSSQVKQIQQKTHTISPQLSTQLNRILDEGVEHKRSLLKDVAHIGDLDGFAAWRLKEAVDLSDLVQRRLKYLQNPDDCDSAKKLICKLNKLLLKVECPDVPKHQEKVCQDSELTIGEFVGYLLIAKHGLWINDIHRSNRYRPEFQGCGYGCQLHHAVYCLIVAYGTERTMILQSKGWRYNRAGWEKVFLPVSETCTEVKGIVNSWPGSPHSPAILLGIVDSISPRPNYLPLAVPRDLADRIERLHGDPSVWWIGQFLKYLLRPQPTTTDMLRDAALKFKYQRPIVGVHIRRTDKVGTEAAFHSVDEYMLHVEEYYHQIALSQKVKVKRIYLASDDYRVFGEIKEKYPEYEVAGDPQIAKTAAVSARYSDNSLNGIIMDIYFLAQSDYLVCTFSSQVCRVAYEIMQSLHPDASTRFRSLDDIYYYGGQGVHRKVAIMKHRASSPDQLDLEVGDVVGVAGNHWDGYSKGRNLRTHKDGLYPSFKVKDVVEAVDFPNYSHVPLREVKDD